MQNGIIRKAFNRDQILSNAKLLITAVRDAHKSIIFGQHSGLPYEYLSRYNVFSMRRRGVDPRSPYLAEGSTDWQLVKELVPSKDDLILKKNTPSLFVGTMAEQLLHNKGVDTIFLAGVSTEGGIEATARHAACLGFFPIIVEDGVG